MFKTQNTAFKIEENLSAENKLQVLCNINKIQISWVSWKRINEIRQQTDIKKWAVYGLGGNKDYKDYTI